MKNIDLDLSPSSEQIKPMGRISIDGEVFKADCGTTIILDHIRQEACSV